MTSLKPIAAAVLAACFVSGPVVAAAHQQQEPTHPSFDVLKPVASSAYSIMHENSTKSGTPGIRIGSGLRLSGMMNVDAFYAQHGPMGFVPGFGDNISPEVGKNVDDLYVNNANLLVDYKVNRCTDLHLGLAYLSDSPYLLGHASDFTNLTTAPVGEPVRDGGTAFLRGRLTVDEVYATFADFDITPFYAKVGKMYTMFGDNPDVYPETYSLTQLLSQTRATGVEAGLMTGWGLHGSLGVYSGMQSRRVATSFLNSRVNNFGAQIGFRGMFEGYDVDAGIDYLYDIRDVSYLDFTLDRLRTETTLPNVRLASALAGHVSVDLGPFSGEGQFVAATRNLVTSDNSSQIWAWTIDGTYKFNIYRRPAHVMLGFQRSGDSDFMSAASSSNTPLLPKWRFITEVGYNLLPHVDGALQYTHDRNWDSIRSTGIGTTLADRNNDIFKLRLSVVM